MAIGISSSFNEPEWDEIARAREPSIPRRATPAMIRAGLEYIYPNHPKLGKHVLAELYEVMTRAA